MRSTTRSGGLLQQEAHQIEAWCRARSDDPDDFERRIWPDGRHELVHLPSGRALVREGIRLDESADDYTVTLSWHEDWARPVTGQEEAVPAHTKPAP